MISHPTVDRQPAPILRPRPAWTTKVVNVDMQNVKRAHIKVSLIGNRSSCNSDKNGKYFNCFFSWHINRFAKLFVTWYTSLRTYNYRYK